MVGMHHIFARVMLGHDHVQLSADNLSILRGADEAKLQVNQIAAIASVRSIEVRGTSCRRGGSVEAGNDTFPVRPPPPPAQEKPTPPSRSALSCHPPTQA